MKSIYYDIIPGIKYCFELDASYDSQKFRQNYAEYLSLPYDEDLKEFRSSASVLGDKAFLVRLSSQAGRLFLRPGRPAKENNLITNE